jgi:hypothetical protein
VSKKASIAAALPLAMAVPGDIMNDFPSTGGWINDFGAAAEQMTPDFYEGIDLERIAREIAEDPKRQKELQDIIDQMGQ